MLHHNLTVFEHLDVLIALDSAMDASVAAWLMGHHPALFEQAVAYAMEIRTLAAGSVSA